MRQEQVPPDGVLSFQLSPPDFPSPPGCFIGFSHGTTSQIWRYGGSDRTNPVNAFASELVGLVGAAVACFQLRPNCEVVFRCDNQAALHISAGEATGQTHVVVRACQGLHMGLRYCLLRAPTYDHVRGHSGDPANELADALAESSPEHLLPSPFGIEWDRWFLFRGTGL